MPSLPSDASAPAPVVLDEDQTSSAQHSRSSSMQSTATDYNDSKDGKVPDIVRRDMEFFMARLTRTTSNDSTESN
jgi:hypothetical protein